MKFQSPMRDRQMLRRTEKPTVGRVAWKRDHSGDDGFFADFFW